MFSTLRPKKRNQTVCAYLMLLPQLIGLTAFGILPLIIVSVTSFTDWNVIGDLRFVGWESILAEVTHPVFHKAMLNTFKFVLMNVPFSLICSLVMAIFLQKIRFKVFFRAVFFMPVITSTVAAVMVWQWLFNPDFSPINFFIHDVLHIPGKILWLGSTSTALPSIVLMNTWQTMGYGLVLFLAGLNGIPEPYYEAATIDGANSWQKTWHITIPLLSPTTFYCVITSVIASFQVFGQPYLLTEGGPVKSTYTVAMHIFDRGFKSMEMGRACAVSLCLLLIIIGITVIQFVSSKRWVFYEGD